MDPFTPPRHPKSLTAVVYREHCPNVSYCRRLRRQYQIHTARETRSCSRSITHDAESSSVAKPDRPSLRPPTMTADTLATDVLRNPSLLSASTNTSPPSALGIVDPLPMTPAVDTLRPRASPWLSSTSVRGAWLVALLSPLDLREQLLPRRAVHSCLRCSSVNMAPFQPHSCSGSIQKLAPLRFDHLPSLASYFPCFHNPSPRSAYSAPLHDRVGTHLTAILCSPPSTTNIARRHPSGVPSVVSVCPGAVKTIGARRRCMEPGQRATVVWGPPARSNPSSWRNGRLTRIFSEERTRGDREKVHMSAMLSTVEEQTGTLTDPEALVNPHLCPSSGGNAFLLRRGCQGA